MAEVSLTQHEAASALLRSRDKGEGKKQRNRGRGKRKKGGVAEEKKGIQNEQEKQQIK